MIRQQYLLREKLADALYGSVCVCADTRAGNELVAIKQVSLELAQAVLATHPDVDNPWRERRAVATLLTLPPHPHVLRFRHEFLHNESWFVVMDLCKDGDLWDYVRRAPQSRLPELEALRVFRQVARGVHFLHMHGIAHRDVSLENVLLREGECKIADFGLSTDAHELCVDVVGKAYYMAPEVVAGHYYDPCAADMWSLGVLLFILLTGSPLVPKAGAEESAFVAFRRMGVRHVVQAWGLGDDISEETCRLLATMLRSEPSERLTTTDVLRHPSLR